MQTSKKTKILIVSGVFPPDQSATAHLIDRLLPVMEDKCIVDGLSFKTNFSDPKVQKHGNATVYRADWLLGSPRRIKCLRDFQFKLFGKLRSMVKKRANTSPIYKEKKVSALIRTMKKMSINKYDAIIAVCAYYDAAEAVVRYKEKYGFDGKIILYQVDPLAENAIYASLGAEHNIRYEKNLYKVFDHVFTTPIVMKQKGETDWDLSNVTALEFPIVFQDYATKQDEDKNGEIKCVFAGLLYGKLRDATYTLKLFSELNDPNIHLYMIGKGQNELLESYANGALKGRLHLLGEKSVTECDELLSHADVLVNIGNTVNNQVPSKLLHYIGFGKPILNIVCSQSCPTIPYMARYPLALNVEDVGSVSESLADSVKKWLYNIKSATLSAEYLKELFRSCTNEYISEQIVAQAEEENDSE